MANALLNVTVINGEGATVTLQPDLFPPVAGIEDPANPGRFGISVPPHSTSGGDIVVVKDGFVAIRHRLQNNLGQEFDGVNGVPLGIPKDGAWELKTETLVSKVIFPPQPTRERVCGVNLTFQGLYVDVAPFGTLPWFEPALQCLLDYSQRQAVYAAKHAAGDTHLIIEFLPGGIIYDEPGQPYQVFSSPNFEYHLDQFLALVEEIIIEGFVPILTFNGDNGDNPNDGYPNALRQLPILTTLLSTSQYRDLNQDVLYARLWDGVFYGSTPRNIQDFGVQFRRLNPTGYLAIEHNTGHIPVGNGPADYDDNGAGMMSTYDVVLSEFTNGLPRNSDPNPDDNPGSSIWQIVGRCVQPYNRPADQPPQTDRYPPPFYLVDSPRGPRYYCAFEFDEYRWVRRQVTKEDIDAQRAYLKSLGCKYTG